MTTISLPHAVRGRGIISIIMLLHPCKGYVTFIALSPRASAINVIYPEHGCNKEFILHSTQYCHNSFDSVNKAFYHKCALYQTSKGVTVHWGTLSDLLHCNSL